MTAAMKSARPTRKWQHGGLAAFITSVVMYVLGRYGNVDAGLASIITTGVGLAVAYFTAPSIEDQVVEARRSGRLLRARMHR
jgi:hypothetical protein